MMAKYTKQGVRNLDALKPKQPSPKVHRPMLKEFSILDGPMDHDLIYGTESYQDIKDRFPHARIENTYDWLRGDRLVVKIPDCSLRTWLKFLITEGWAEVSLILQFMLIDNAPAIEEVLEETSPGWRETKR